MSIGALDELQEVPFKPKTELDCCVYMNVTSTARTWCLNQPECTCLIKLREDSNAPIEATVQLLNRRGECLKAGVQRQLIIEQAVFHLSTSRKSFRLLVTLSNGNQTCTKRSPLIYTSKCLVGRVGINDPNPKHELVVRGDIQYTGNLWRQSDATVKEDIRPVQPEDQLERLRQLRVYDYRYAAEFNPAQPTERGILAQEVQVVMPEAVVDRGILLVDRDALVMETMGAVQAVANSTEELSKRLDKAEHRSLIQVVNYYTTNVRHGLTLAHPCVNVCCFGMVWLWASLFFLSLTQKDDSTTSTTFLLSQEEFLSLCGTATTAANANGRSHSCNNLYNAYASQMDGLLASSDTLPWFLFQWIAGLALTGTLCLWSLLAFTLALRLYK